MSRKIDLRNKRFGKLIAKEAVGSDSNGGVFWRCLCDCGNEKVATRASLQGGKTRSCGCLRSEAMEGNQYGLGTKRTPETRAKMSASLTGRIFSPEHCANIRKSRTADFRARQNRAMSGENNPMYGKTTPDGVKAKIGLAMKGNKHLLGHKHSVETREKMSDAQKGENHPNWRGGTTHDPYGSIFQNKDFRETILQRDSYQCQNPDCWGTSEKLCLHHIDYDKQHCTEDNLIALCQSCNMRANSNREQHTIYYNAMMQEKYKDISIHKGDIKWVFKNMILLRLAI